MPRPTAGPRRIGLVGGECSGKSTLAGALARDLPACLVDEVLRQFVDQHGRPPRHEEQAGLLADQIRREDESAAACSLDWLVADATPLMTAIYSILYFGDASQIPAAVSHARGYGLVAWCAPDIPWQGDGPQRDGIAERAAADSLIADLVEAELRPRGIPVIRVSGSVPARTLAVRRAWQPGGHQPLT